MLAATIVRGGQDAAILNVLASVGDAGRSDWQRSALLRGAEVAVLNSPMPGAVGASRRAADCECAVPHLSWWTRRPGRGLCVHRGNAPAGAGRGGQRTVRLTREPAGPFGACRGGRRSRRARRQRAGAH